MGYDIHITRREYWADPNGPRIDEDEWADAVDADGDLDWDERNGSLDATFGGKDGTPLWYSEGNISTKNPSRAAIRKMYQVAEALSAVVQGDEGELYNAEGRQCDSPVSNLSKPEPNANRKPTLGWRATLRKLIFGE